jgi:hypothetical protein
MRRSLVLFTFVVCGLIALSLAAVSPHLVGAKTGTPAADESDMPTGIGFEALAYGQVTALPTVPGFAILERLTMAPGASLSSDANAPGFALMYLESGTLTVRVDAPFAITRAATVASAVEAGTFPMQEEIAAGSESSLAQGDSIVFPPLAAVELRNDGTEPVVILAMSITPTGEDENTPTS